MPTRRHRDSRLPYKGVSLVNGRYRAHIVVGGKRRHLGYFGDILEAARAYDGAAREVMGKLARLNFPGPGEMGAL